MGKQSWQGRSQALLFLASLAEEGAAVLACHADGPVAGPSTPPHPAGPPLTSQPPRGRGGGGGADGSSGDAGGRLDPRLNLLKDGKM